MKTRNPDNYLSLKSIFRTVIIESQIELLKMVLSPKGLEIQFFREFDPGSGRTLAACLTHASRTELVE